MTPRPWALLAIATLLAAWLSVSKADGPSDLSAEQRAADFASFCRFVEEEYAYFDLKKTDWARVCRFYAPQAASATDRAAYIELLEQALGELYDSHAHLGTNTQRSYRLVPTHTSLFATWKDGKAIVSAVRTGSGAEGAGLRPGMEVVAINGEATETVVRSIEPKLLSREDSAAREWALQVALAGRRDRDSIRLLTRQGDETREFEFASSQAEPASLLSYRVVGKVGTIRINNTLGNQALVQAIDAALSDLFNVQALVIDLRDTPSGGNSSVARGIIGRFVERMLPYQRHELVSELRSTGIRRVWDEYVAPRGSPFLKPIVVLVGRWTGSMGEGLAIGLNATRGAPVLGQPMAHLLGANGEAVLPHSRIVVRVPTEKLSHIDGSPREAFVPCAIASSGVKSSTQDPELASAIALGARLSALKSNVSIERTHFGLAPPCAAHRKPDRKENRHAVSSRQAH
jgi:carboxyl-terminal processing protease